VPNTGDAPDPKYQMRYAIPNFGEVKYSLLSNMTAIVLAFGVLFIGLLADKFSRKWMITIASFSWSATTFGTSFCVTYGEVAAMRILLGFFESFIGPPSFSIIADTFPPEKRTAANAVYNFGVYFGASLSNLTLLIIEAVGWRLAFAIVGSIGFLIGLQAMLVIREPGRNVFDPIKIEKEQVKTIARLAEEDTDEALLVAKEPEAKKDGIMKEYANGCCAMFKQNCIFWLLLAGMLRAWQG